jgi:hypothetical protein
MSEASVPAIGIDAFFMGWFMGLLTRGRPGRHPPAAVEREMSACPAA